MRRTLGKAKHALRLAECTGATGGGTRVVLAKSWPHASCACYVRAPRIVAEYGALIAVGHLLVRFQLGLDDGLDMHSEISQMRVCRIVHLLVFRTLQARPNRIAL